jgi:hypothetical protein
MSSLTKIQTRLIDAYQIVDKYPQIDQILNDASYAISKAQATLMVAFHDGRVIGKTMDPEFVKKQLKEIVKYLTGLMYCFDLELPEEEDIIEFTIENISDAMKVDIILSLFNIQGQIAELTIQYYLDKSENMGEELELDYGVLYGVIMEIFSNVNNIGFKFGLPLADLIM